MMQTNNEKYEAKILVRGRPVKEVVHNSTCYIEGRKGTEYTLSFKNKSSKRVMVIPSVDGLCVVDGKPAGQKSSGYIVDPYESIDIPGWMVDNSTAAKFTFWPQDARGEQTYVEELSKSGARVDIGNQGLIGFLVMDEVQKAPYYPTGGILRGGVLGMPPDPWNTNGMHEWHGPVTSSIIGSGSTMGIADQGHNSAMLSSSVGTKFGESTEFNTTSVPFERNKVVGTMVIEYDSLRGLKDRGIDTSLFTGSQKLYGERSAFPADTPSGCKPPAGWSK